MKRFSIGESIGDGFGLIARRPLAVFVWGLLLLAPTFASFGLMLPMMGEMFAEMPSSGSDYPADSAFPGQLMAEMMQFQLVSMLLNIVQLLMMVVVYTAIFRAVLRPRESSVFSLRIGMDELRVAVVGMAIGVGLYAVMFVFILIAAAVGFALWGSDPTVAIGSVALLAVLLLLFVFWGCARVSMMAPASVLYRDFAFVPGWRLAAGQSWPLFGMMVLIVLMILAIEIVLVLVGLFAFSGLWASVGATWGETAPDVAPFAGMEAWFAANWYWAVIGGAVVSLFYGCVLTLGIAPFASACRQLVESGGPAPDEAAGSPAASVQARLD